MKKEKGLLILGSKKYPDCTSVYDVKMKDFRYNYFHKVLLKYSHVDGGWSKPGNKAYSLTSDGNGFIFKDHWTNTEIKLDYSQADALRALLKLSDSDGRTFNYNKVKK